MNTRYGWIYGINGPYIPWYEEVRGDFLLQRLCPDKRCTHSSVSKEFFERYNAWYGWIGSCCKIDDPVEKKDYFERVMRSIYESLVSEAKIRYKEEICPMQGKELMDEYMEELKAHEELKAKEAYDNEHKDNASSPNESISAT